MRARWRILSGWAAAAVLLLLASACGGSSDDGGDTTTTDAAATADADADAATEADPDPDADASAGDDAAADDDDESDVAGGEGPMRIEALMALSGPLAAAGEAMVLGMEAAVEVVNADGGVLGQPVELNVTDDASSPDEIVARLQEILAAGGADAVIPGSSAAEMSAAIPILAEAGVFTVHHHSDVSFNDPEAYPLAFGVSFGVPAYAESMADELSTYDFSSVGVLAIDDASGPVLQEILGAALEERGIESTYAFVAPGAVDATPQLQQVLDAAPDALVFAGFGPTAGPMAQARVTLGTDLPTFATQTLTASNLADLAPDSAWEGIRFQNLRSSVQGTATTDSEAFQTFYEQLLDLAGGELPFPINAYIVAYNDVILASYAANLAGSLDPEAMAAALESASDEDLPLFLAPGGFSADNHWARFGTEHYVFHSYGPVENGLMVPGEIYD